MAKIPIRCPNGCDGPYFRSCELTDYGEHSPPPHIRLWNWLRGKPTPAIREMITGYRVHCQRGCGETFQVGPKGTSRVPQNAFPPPPQVYDRKQAQNPAAPYEPQVDEGRVAFTQPFLPAERD